MPEQVVKLKKKQWYPIIAPKQFEEVVLGETLVAEPQQMLGRTLSHSLMNLTNDVKRQNVNIHFKIVEVENNRAKTNIIGYEIVPSSIKRFVRRNSLKADLSFNCETSDNVLLRVKPLVITRANIKGSVAAKLRNNIIAFLTKTIKKMTYEEALNDLILHKLQNLMKSAFNKIYPLKACEIRYLGIETRDKRQKGQSQEIKAEVEAEVKEVKVETQQETKQ